MALVALVAVARWGTWQGPVVFAAPDVPFLLGAPLARRALAARPLARGLVARRGRRRRGRRRGARRPRRRGTRHRRGPRGRARAPALALLGVLGVAGAGARAVLGALVAGDRRRAARLAGRSAPRWSPWRSASDTGRRVALWSGPWGWALQPVSRAGTAASLLGARAAGGA